MNEQTTIKSLDLQIVQQNIDYSFTATNKRIDQLIQIISQLHNSQSNIKAEVSCLITFMREIKQVMNKGNHPDDLVNNYDTPNHLKDVVL